MFFFAMYLLKCMEERKDSLGNKCVFLCNVPVEVHGGKKRFVGKQMCFSMQCAC